MNQIRTRAGKCETNKEGTVGWAGMTNGFHFSKGVVKFGNEVMKRIYEY
jgi:hypothetical protein